MEILQKSSANFGDRNGYKPEIIVLHIMAGTLSGTDDWFSRPESQASSHYGIGYNGEVHQYVADEKAAWTQGVVNQPTFKLYKPGINPNLYCLSIENEGYSLAQAPETQLEALVKLIVLLATKYNISIDRSHVIGHYEINPIGKPSCPTNDRTFIDKIVARCQLILPTNSAKQLLSEIEDRVTKLKGLL